MSSCCRFLLFYVKLINGVGNVKWFGINGGFYFPKGLKWFPKEVYGSYVFGLRALVGDCNSRAIFFLIFGNSFYKMVIYKNIEVFYPLLGF